MTAKSNQPRLDRVTGVVEEAIRNKLVEIAFRGRPYSKADEERFRSSFELRLLPEGVPVRLEDLHFDALDVVECIMSIEEELGIGIPDDVADAIMTTDELLKAAIHEYENEYGAAVSVEK